MQKSLLERLNPFGKKKDEDEFDSIQSSSDSEAEKEEPEKVQPDWP